MQLGILFNLVKRFLYYVKTLKNINNSCSESSIVTKILILVKI